MAKIVIALLIIACIAPLFIKGPDGEPIMSLDDWKFSLPGSVDELLPGVDDAAEPADLSEPTTVYKWQDDEGQWHFSSTPPPEEANAESMELDGNINLMDAPPSVVEVDTVVAGNESGIAAAPMTVSPDQLKEMMETVTNLQETVDQRKADIDAVLPPE